VKNVVFGWVEEEKKEKLRRPRRADNLGSRTKKEDSKRKPLCCSVDGQTIFERERRCEDKLGEVSARENSVE